MDFAPIFVTFPGSFTSVQMISFDHYQRVGHIENDMEYKKTCLQVGLPLRAGIVQAPAFEGDVSDTAKVVCDTLSRRRAHGPCLDNFQFVTVLVTRLYCLYS